MSPLASWLLVLAMLATITLIGWRAAIIGGHRVNDAIDEALNRHPAAPRPVAPLGCVCRSCNDARDLIGLDDWLRTLAESGDQR